jgi:tetratricopeptide (TPR) repeat protein
VRTALGSIVGAVTASWGERRPIVSTHLLAYAALLFGDGQWALAADVYLTFLAYADTADEAEQASYACVRLGTCLVRLDRLVEAEWAHESGRAIAAQLGQRYAEHLAQHGLAVVAIHRGNLPAADDQLAAVIASCDATSAEEPALVDVQARALHDRGRVALRRGDTEHAFTWLYDAMLRHREPYRRDRALHDLATAFMQVGLRTTARQALLVLEAHSHTPELRWDAALALMRLAVLDGSETVFERYRRQLADAPLPPSLAVDYAVAVGDGCRRFGREPQARAAFDRALTLADEHHLNDQLIDAGAPRTSVPGAPGAVAMRVADAIDRLSAGVRPS